MQLIPSECCLIGSQTILSHEVLAEIQMYIESGRKRDIWAENRRATDQFKQTRCHNSRAQCLAWAAVQGFLVAQIHPHALQEVLQGSRLGASQHLKGHLMLISVCVCVGTNMLPPPQNQWQKNRCDKWLRALGLWETRAASKPKLSLQKEKANISGRKDWQPKREKAGSWDTTGSQQWTTSCTWTASVLQRSGQGAEIPICKHTSCRSGQTAAVRPQPGERGRQDSREGWWWRECMMHTRLGASTQHSSDQPGWRDRCSA